MVTRTGNAVWEGTLKEGKGSVKLGSGAYEGPYSFTSRFENGKGTNPEELIGAAHAGCFSMALANELAQAGHPAKRVSTTARVHLEKTGDGFRITSIDLNTEAEVPGIDEQTFLKQADTAKKNCPVSKALGGTEIKLQARLMKAAG
ncbi:MAG: OsmC family protein [Blastocatellales bacterium]